MAMTAHVDPSERERNPDGRVDLGELMSILGRRWLSIATWLVITLAAAAAYLATATPIYRASASILLDPRGGAALSSSEGTAGRLSQDVNLIESQVRLVSSPSVLARVVQSQHLVDDPEFNTPRPSEGQWLRRLLGTPGAEPPALPRDQQVLAALAQRLDVKRSERSLIIDIEVESRDPAKAARLADAVAAAFVEDQLAAKAQAAGREGSRLDARLRELETSIKDGERKIEAFKAKNRILDASNGTLDEQQLNELNSALVRARSQGTEARARLAQVQRIGPRGTQLETLPESLRSSVVGSLRAQYAEAQRRIDTLGTTLGARHPDLMEARQQLSGVQAQIAEELRRIAAGLRHEVDVAAANEAAAARALDAKKREMTTTNGARVDLRTLERAVQTDKASYDRLLSADNTLQQEGAPTPIARPLAPALLPLRPASPNARAILLIAGALGLALGLATALFREHRARSRWSVRVTPLSPALVPEPVPAPPGPSYVRRFHVGEATGPSR